MAICGGRVAKGVRFCIKDRALCGHLHEPKLKLAPGFYIKAPSGRRSLESAFVHPYVTNEQAQNCLSFKHLFPASLPLP